MVRLAPADPPSSQRPQGVQRENDSPFKETFMPDQVIRAKHHADARVSA